MGCGVVENSDHFLYCLMILILRFEHLRRWSNVLKQELLSIYYLCYIADFPPPVFFKRPRCLRTAEDEMRPEGFFCGPDGYRGHGNKSIRSVTTFPSTGKYYSRPIYLCMDKLRPG